jgi:hypothetical protein
MLLQAVWPAARTLRHQGGPSGGLKLMGTRMITTAISEQAAAFDIERQAVVVTGLVITDLAVVSESRRWSSGVRGDAVSVAAMAGADLTGFVTQALSIGATAITAAGNAQDTFDLERLITEVGTRTAESSDQAAKLTTKAASDATKTMTCAAEAARKAIAEADSASRKCFEATVSAAQSQLRGDLQRLFGGTNPELVERLQPVLEKFGADLDTKVAKQTAELLSKAARQFDPTEPASPMAKHAAELTKQQEALAGTLARNHEALVTRVEALVTAVSAQAAAQHATARIASVTPLKGTTYADGVHALMSEIASGLGDEYADTGTMAGRIARNKKGDGLLTIGDAVARVVLEMTDSPRSQWNEYLDEAERNRAAAASLGLVRDQAQNAGQSIRVLGSRRIVMAFDPAADDPSLLRTVVLLLRTAAIAASARHGAEEIATAEEKVTEAIGLLAKIDDIQKAAGAIHKSASKISCECDAFHSGIERLLTQALTALAGAEVEAAYSGPAPTQRSTGAA